MIALLALSDDGAPADDHENAQASQRSACPTSSWTPDLFPDLTAAAIEKCDVGARAAQAGIVASRA